MTERHCVFRNGSQLVFLVLPWSSSHPSPSLISPAAFGLRGSATLETLPLINVEETEAMATGSRLTAMRARRHYEERQGCSAHEPNKTCHNNNKQLRNDHTPFTATPPDANYQIMWPFTNYRPLGSCGFILMCFGSSRGVSVTRSFQCDICELKPWTYWSVSCVLKVTQRSSIYSLFHKPGHGLRPAEDQRWVLDKNRDSAGLRLWI